MKVIIMQHLGCLLTLNIKKDKVIIVVNRRKVLSINI